MGTPASARAALGIYECPADERLTDVGRPLTGSEGPAVIERHTYAMTTGAEDLLDLSQAGLPEAHLDVHYRSRDSRLIAFFEHGILRQPPSNFSRSRSGEA